MDPRRIHLASLIVLGVAVACLLTLQFLPWATHSAEFHSAGWQSPGAWDMPGMQMPEMHSTWTSWASTWGHSWTSEVNGVQNEGSKGWYGDWGSGEDRTAGVVPLRLAAPLVLLAALGAAAALALGVLRFGNAAGAVAGASAFLLLLATILFMAGVSTLYDGVRQTWHAGAYFAIGAVVLLGAGGLLSVMLPDVQGEAQGRARGASGAA